MALIKYIGEEVQSKIYYIFGWEKESVAVFTVTAIVKAR